MTSKQLLQINKIRSILAMVWQKKGLTEFHYSDMDEIIRKHKGGLALSTSCVAVGLMVRPRKGYLNFCRKPTEADAVKIYEHFLTAVRAAYFKKHQSEILTKKEEVKYNSREIKVIDEQYCIDYLKSKGYKIMKPIQPQYEEI